jgi:hypothetical protein
MIVNDGKGSGRAASVNADNQLATKSVVVSAIHAASLKGDAYSFTAVSADINAGDTALLVANQSKDRLLVIEKVYAYSDVPTQLKVHCPAVGTWAGTAVVGVNLNRLSTKTADAVAYADETGNTFAAANTVVTLNTNELTTAEFPVEYDFKGAVILGYDDAIAVDIIAESAAFDCTFLTYFIDNPNN